MTIAEALPGCPDFRWMPGMLNQQSGGRLVRDWGGGVAWWVHDDAVKQYGINGGLPDLTDPATLGCLLALVRIAYDDPTLSPVSDGSLWAAVIYDAATDSEITVSEEYGEGEALAVALLAKSDPRWLGPHGEFVRVRLVP